MKDGWIIRYLESISEFQVSFDGVVIPGTTLNADGTFLVNYFVPYSTVIGSHTVTVYTKDNKGKTANKDVAITVEEGDILPD